jgi:hypothetical protein
LRIRVITPLSPPNGAVVLVAAYGPKTGTGGIYRSTDTGETFGAGSVLPAGDGWAIIEDPVKPGRVYAAHGGAGTAGIYRSDNAGATWSPASAGIAASDLTAALWIRLSVRPGQAGAASTLYAGIVTHTGRGAYGGNQVSRLYTTAAIPGQEVWAPVPLPSGGGDAINPLGEANAKFAMAADPAHPMLFAGGDQHGVWRADVTDPANPVWQQVSKAAQFAGANVPDDAPHDDCQALVFDAAGDLLAANDGGVYRLLDPSGPAPTWVHLGATMRNNEALAVAYDTLSGVAVVASADNGVSAQESRGSQTWRTFNWGDGFETDVDNSAATFSWRYSDSDNALYRHKFDATNGAGNQPPPGGQLALAGLDATEKSVTFALNTVAGDRLLFGGTHVYESVDGGSTVAKVLPRPPGATGGIRMVCGGMENGTAQPEVAYVAFGSQLWLRPAGTSRFSQVSAYPGTGQIAYIAIDPLDWRRVCVADNNQLFRTQDVTDPPRFRRPPPPPPRPPLPPHPGHPWIDCTGDLLGQITDGQLAGAVVLIHRSGPADSTEAVFVGALGGLFRTLNAADGANARWRRFGTNLPRCATTGLRYYPPQARAGGSVFGDVLVVGLQGRGVWLLPSAGPRLLFPDPVEHPQERTVPAGTRLQAQRAGDYEGLGMRRTLRPN